MFIDTQALLRELEFRVAEGETPGSWFLSAPDGTRFEVLPEAFVNRLDARIARESISKTARLGVRPLLIGPSATASVLEQAHAGSFDLLTAEPLPLVHGERSFTSLEQQPAQIPTTRKSRPAWTRWAIVRFLLLNSEAATQTEIAARLNTSQQAVSIAVKALGSLVASGDSGVYAPDKSALLANWLADYPGPGGHEFGWFSLDSVNIQVAKALEVSLSLGAQPLVSGDVAADALAPWKIPSVGRVYVREPVDLAGDGFVPAPLEQASLVVCQPADPMLWVLAEVMVEATAKPGLPLVDLPVVVWDLLRGPDGDSQAAAQKVAELITEWADE